MTARFRYDVQTPGPYEAMNALEHYLAHCAIEERLVHFVKLRASQLNGCAYCIDMHWKDLRALGENEQRLYGLDAWRESPYYSPRERAALAWTEAVTHVATSRVPDDVYRDAREHFDERAIGDLTLVVATINAWNRLAIASGSVPGAYRSRLTPAAV
jgi:AhpD family alkylhydroperoxidase